MIKTGEVEGRFRNNSRNLDLRTPYLRDLTLRNFDHCFDFLDMMFMLKIG